MRGRVPLAISTNPAGRQPANSRQAPGPRLLARSRAQLERARGALDMQGLRPHQAVEQVFEQHLGLIQVHRPADPENPVAEQLLRLGIPVRRAYAFPCGRSEVVGYGAEHATMPRALGLRLGELGRDGSHHEPYYRKSYRTADSMQSPHTSRRA